MQHDTTDNCRLYVTTMKAMTFQDDIPSIPVDNFIDHYVLVSDLTSMQDATEHCHYLELIGEPKRLEHYFSLPLENFEKSLYLVNVCLLLQSTSLVLWEIIFEMDNTSLKQIVYGILLLKYRYIGSFPPDIVPRLPIDTFAIIKTEPSNTPGEHWILIAKSHHELCFADSLGLSINNYHFLKQNSSQMIRTIIPAYAVSTQFMPHYICSSFNKQEITGVHDVNVLSTIRSFMQFITNLL